MLNCWIIMQPKKTNLLLSPFVVGEMNMSSGKRGCCRLDSFFLDCQIVIDSAKEGNMLLRPFTAREMNMSSGKKGCC